MTSTVSYGLREFVRRVLRKGRGGPWDRWSSWDHRRPRDGRPWDRPSLWVGAAPGTAAAHVAHAMAAAHESPLFVGRRRPWDRHSACRRSPRDRRRPWGRRTPSGRRSLSHWTARGRPEACTPPSRQTLDPLAWPKTVKNMSCGGFSTPRRHARQLVRAVFSCKFETLGNGPNKGPNMVPKPSKRAAGGAPDPRGALFAPFCFLNRFGPFHDISPTAPKLTSFHQEQQ